MGFTLLMELLVFCENKEKFTKKQRISIINFYKKKLKKIRYKRVLMKKTQK